MEKVADSVDMRIKQQARQLQGLLARLMEPPKELQATPLVDIELSPREIGAVLLLGDKGEMIMTDLSSALGAPLSTVTRIMDRLEQKSFISRSRSDRDRRIVVVRPGEKGKILHETVRHHQLLTAERMLYPLTGGEREILLELMGKLTKALRERD
jgi:DNA-binding MarR family transcriptional regulator